MHFSAALVLLVSPFLALAGPVDQTVDPSSGVEKRTVPGCVIGSKWGGEWTEAGLARYRTEFHAEKIPSADVCKTPYFTCLGMSNRQCWTQADGVTIVDGSFAKGAGFGTYTQCLHNAKIQWAKDNGCKCEGEFC